MPSLTGSVRVLRSLPTQISTLFLFLVCLLLPAAVRAQVTFTGAQPVLASFPVSDSISPVAVDALGDAFFVVTTGTHNTLYEVPVNGILTTLNNSFGFFPSAIAVDSKGANLYFIYFGSTPSCGGGYVYLATSTTASGAIGANLPCSFTFSGFNLTYSDPAGLALDAAGNLYIADFGGGEIFKLPAPVTSSSVPTQFMALFQQPWDLAVSGSGTIDYTALDFSNNSSNSLFQVSTSSFTSTVPSNGVTATALADNLPSIQSGLAIDGAGNIYVGGNGSPTVKQIGGAQVRMYNNFTNGTTGTAVDSLGNVYLTGTTGTGVPELVALNLSGGTGGKVGPKPVNVGMTSGALALNFDVAAGTTIGNIAILTNGIAGKDFADGGSTTCKAQTYATETACVVSVHVTPHSAGLRLGAVVVSGTGGDVLATGRVHAIGAAPQLIFQGGTPVTVATGLSEPLGLKVDGAGNVLIADAFNGRVLKVTPAGVQSTVGSGFSAPSGIAVDGAGNIFVADLNAGTIYKVTPGGVQTAYLTGLSQPYGISVDAMGSLYISEPSANTVLKVTQVGVQTTVGSGYSLPYENAVDIAGNVYVGDFGSGNVFKVTPAGIQSTIASGLSEPTGVAVDAAGDVYVAAFGGAAISQIMPGGATATVVNGLDGPYGVALDPGGNLYYTEFTANVAGKITQSLSPTVGFATTPGGSISSDSPKVVALQNVGNTPLQFTKVLYVQDFPKDASGNATACAANTALTATGVCTLTLDFAPVTLSGTNTSLALSKQEQVTTNTLNATGTISHVTVTGTETKLVPTLALTAGMVTSGGVPSLLLTVHASGSGATPTGTVSFYAGGVLVGTSTPLSANGNVSFTTPRPTQRHTFTAVNTGDAVYASGKSNGILINPTDATPTVTLTVTPNPAAVNQSVTFTAAVSTTIAGVPPTGNVKFSVSNVVVGTVALSGGVASFSTGTMTAGTHTIVATYLGDANYLSTASNSVKETVTVTK